MKYTLLALTAVVGGIVTTALTGHAATNLSNSLTGFTGDTSQVSTQTALDAAGFSVFSTAADPRVVFDATGARFGTGTMGDGGRNYLRTTASDYASIGFVAEITFENSDAQQAFFGMGSGDTALFGTPDWSTQLTSASFWPEPQNDKFVRFKTTNDMNTFADAAVPGFAGGTHRFRMTFDPSANTLTGEIDLNYAGGPFAADASGVTSTSNLFSADGWPSEPSRIFFGGDDGAVFRDLSIQLIPEPNAAALAAIALVAVGSMRRRKR